jgi:hypothetical protein
MIDWIIWIIGLAVGGLFICILVVFIWVSTSDKPHFSFMILLPGILFVAILNIANSYTAPVNLDNLQVEYKSIGVENGKYYAIEKDGDIFTITQEQWAELEVPVIAQTK